MMPIGQYLSIVTDLSFRKKSSEPGPSGNNLKPMNDLVYRWDSIQPDTPVPLLHRRLIKGEQILLAMIRLEKGCTVALHHHHSEQVAYVISGRVRWGLGEPGTPERREFEMGGGEVLHLPSNLPHQIEALEESQILDMLSPPGPMGVDQQNRASRE